jgi:PAS domain S-box-containing protein
MIGKDILLKALEHTGSPVTIADATLSDAPLVFANRAFYEVTGYSEDEVIGKNCRFLQGVDTDKHAVHRIAASLRHGKESNETILNYRKNGTSFWNDLLLSPIRDEDGTLTHYVGFQTDITERLEKERANDLVDRIQQELGKEKRLEKAYQNVIGEVRVTVKELENNSGKGTEYAIERLKSLLERLPIVVQ